MCIRDSPWWVLHASMVPSSYRCVSPWCPHGAFVVGAWCRRGASMVFPWCVGASMMTPWCSRGEFCDVPVVLPWWVHGAHVVSPWWVHCYSMVSPCYVHRVPLEPPRCVHGASVVGLWRPHGPWSLCCGSVVLPSCVNGVSITCPWRFRAWSVVPH